MSRTELSTGAPADGSGVRLPHAPSRSPRSSASQRRPLICLPDFQSFVTSRLPCHPRARPKAGPSPNPLGEQQDGPFSSRAQALSKIACNRLHKELAEWQVSPPSGFKHKVSDNLQRWVIKVTGAAGTLDAGETYQLQVDFPEHYPMEAPQVIFLNPAPMNPHIYSNGHICLGPRKHTVVRHTSYLLFARVAKMAKLVMVGNQLLVLSMVILGCFTILSQSQTTDQMDNNKIYVCLCAKRIENPPCTNNCYCCMDKPGAPCFQTRDACKSFCCQRSQHRSTEAISPSALQ